MHFVTDSLGFLPIPAGEPLMANREQKSNREKKKPKSDKNQKVKAAPPPFQAPELVRKPHKGKGEG
ncbi:MAG: hypothetical protein WDM89_11040 [Rhizomicrobium sp.]